MANSPMGLGLTNTMEPGSYPSWHTNRTPWAQFKAWLCPAVLHGVQWLDQVVNGK